MERMLAAAEARAAIEQMSLVSLREAVPAQKHRLSSHRSRIPSLLEQGGAAVTVATGKVTPERRRSLTRLPLLAAVSAGLLLTGLVVRAGQVVAVLHPAGSQRKSVGRAQPVKALTEATQ